MHITDSCYDKNYKVDGAHIIITSINHEEILDQKNVSHSIVVNYDFFMESQKFNPYYNGKVCIDSNGFVKNCLMLEKTFGNIKDTLLSKILESGKIQELWNVSPDLITGLRESPLRYCLYIPYKLQKIENSQFYEYIDSKDLF